MPTGREDEGDPEVAMNWSDATPWISIAISLGTVAYYAGAWTERGRATDTRIKELREHVDSSAAGQGKRIGKSEDHIAVLLDWKARAEGAAERDRDLSGVVRR